MICQCRLATLRTFLNGLAQVHKIDVFPASSQLFNLPKRSSPTGQSHHHTVQNPRSQAQTRGFHDSRHVSRQQQQDDQPSAATGPSPQPQGQKSKVRWRDLPPGDLKAKIQRREVIGCKIAGSVGMKEAEVLDVQQPKRTAPRKPTGTPGASIKFEAASAGAATTASTTERRATTYKPHRQPKSPATAIATDAESNPPKKPEDWSVQRARLKEKFPEGWKPRKRLSPDALAGLRALNAQFPDVYTTEALAAKFEMSAEAVRRILRGKWQPSEEEESDRLDRWHRRGMQIWETKAALGVKPPRKWRAEGITRDPAYHERRKSRVQRDQEWEEEEVRKYREYRQGLQKAANKII